MPEAEVEITAVDVADLIASQYPFLAGLRVEEVDFGWDNFMFRIGKHHVARFPRREVSAPMVKSESKWLPLLAPHLPLPIPAPIFHGSPGRGFPWTWTIAQWIEGEPAATAQDVDEMRCAVQIGQFLAALHQPAPSDAPQNQFRGGPLDEKRETTSSRLQSMDAHFDTSALDSIWMEACESQVYQGPPLWLHGDLHPNNLIVRHRSLGGVIDFTDLTAGDPACDLMVGWTMFGAEARENLFSVYGDVDPALLRRAKGWAIHHGSVCVANGADNAVMSQIGRVTLERVTTS